MGRMEFLPCLYRDRNGGVQEAPYPKSEPTPYGVPADLYCPSYEVVKGLFGPPKLGQIEIAIFNTRSYHPDRELEEIAKDRLIQAIVKKEGPAIVQAAGGSAAIRQRIDVGPFWEDEPAR
jgi:hypothetical protein